MSPINLRTKLLLKLVSIIILILIIYFGYLLFIPTPLPDNSYKLEITQGESTRTIAKQLESDNIIYSARMFTRLIHIIGNDKKIYAGLYIFNKPISLFDLIMRLSNGHPDQISITILEAWNFRQIRNEIDKTPNIRHITTNMTESQIRASLKISDSNMEGLMFPSTYFVAPNQTDMEVFQIAYNTMMNKLDKTWATHNSNISYKDSYQLLILASLIQKETNNPADMIRVSTVFNNRLRMKMRLQDDPAVFYGLNNQAHITRENFKINTPYNTYLNYGLPPTPICNPSQAALTAAAQPTNDYNLLYFIAIGNGKSKFSNDFSEHSKAVKYYLHKKPPEKNK